MCPSLQRPLPIPTLAFVLLEFMYCSLPMAITLEPKIYALDQMPLHLHAACFNSRLSCNNKSPPDTQIHHGAEVHANQSFTATIFTRSRLAASYVPANCLYCSTSYDHVRPRCRHDNGHCTLAKD